MPEFAVEEPQDDTADNANLSKKQAQTLVARHLTNLSNAIVKSVKWI